MNREHPVKQGVGGRASAEALPIQRQHVGKQTLIEAISPIQARNGGPAAAPTGGAGAALPAQVRGQMEGAFGTSFADVRIHQGEQAAAMDAVAYTQGNDIHFQPGSYDPSSPAGRELLGHELTHVLQQRQGRVAAPGQGKGAGINADAGLEAEADHEGARAARGEAVSEHVRASTGQAAAGVVQRRLVAFFVTHGKRMAAEHLLLGDTAEDQPRTQEESIARLLARLGDGTDQHRLDAIAEKALQLVGKDPPAAEDAAGVPGLLGRNDEDALARRARTLLEDGEARVVIFGHTHTAIDGDREPLFGHADPRRSFNTGSWMPSTPLTGRERWPELRDLSWQHDLRYLVVDLEDPAKATLRLLPASHR